MAFRRPWRPTLQENRAYNHLFNAIDHERKGVISVGSLEQLLEKAHLHRSTVQQILMLSIAHDKVSRHEFHIAMKLVSLAQTKHTPSLDKLANSAPLPEIDGIDLHGQGARSSGFLRYSPQHTADLDEIIRNAMAADGSESDSVGSTMTPSRASEDELKSISDLTPELMFEDTAKKPSAELRVDTKLAASVRQSFDSLDTGGVSADSVAELLGRINAAVPTNTQSTAKLTDEIARLSVLCQKETEENTNIASRLYREEARVSELQRQLHDAQGKIAYIAKQREQLVGRLQLVETKRREMEEMVRQAELCVDKVDRLDDKVFGMERSLVRMQRQLGKSQKAAGVCGSAGSTDNAKTGVLLRYETAKRNRLSSVFSKPALE